MNILILMPVLDDWISAAEVLRRIDDVFASAEDTIRVLFVDDGSSEAAPPGFAQGPYRKIAGVAVVVLKRNVGHQRALALGLCHLAEEASCDFVVVMDSDGEDEPKDAERLVERARTKTAPTVVFAERRKRSESRLFKICYSIYRVLHYSLTGQKIRVGNFSVISAQLLPAITIEPMLWNHYAASIIRSRISIDLVPIDRGHRIDGRSRLGFSSLVIHGLSALACYNEVIGVRLLLLMGALFVIANLSILFITAEKLFTTLAIPGWASVTCILIAVLLMQMATVITNFVLQAIATRSTQPFLPARDYKWFIHRTVELYKRQSS
jgi:glycosyltransferase involved in cell wall biosynthesis